jgi:hypothetical protein
MMSKVPESSSLQELEQIPGVGKTIAQDMQNIGIHSIDALKGWQAEQLYDRLCEFKASPACPEPCRMGRREIRYLSYASRDTRYDI